MDRAFRIMPALLVATSFAALNAWLAALSAHGERISWQGYWEVVLFFTAWSVPAVLAGALLPRAALWVPLPTIGATAMVTELLPGSRGSTRLTDWAVQLVTMQALALAGSAAVRWRRPAATASGPPPSRSLLAAAVVLAVVVPIALGAPWQLRDAPPPWSCFSDAPPGQEAAIAAWRRHLAPALALATAALLAPALAVSRARRGRSRPGTPALVASGLVAAWAVAAVLDEEVLEWLPGLALVLVLSFVVTVPALLGAVVWAVRRPAGARGAAWVLLALWVSLAVTLGGVGASIVARGDEPELCL